MADYASIGLEVQLMCQPMSQVTTGEAERERQKRLACHSFRWIEMHRRRWLVSGCYIHFLWTDSEFLRSAEPSSSPFTPEISSCPRDDVPTANTTSASHCSCFATGSHVNAIGAPLRWISTGDDSVYCQSPTTYVCSGWDCPPIKAEEQTVVCI
jgi:hypothetical protein